MTEHKFTDEEVIKALEHCESGCSCEACVGCPFDEKGACIEAENALAIFALDLINRQKAEIAFWQDAAANAKKEAINEFADRLKEKPIKYGLPLFGLQTKEEIEVYFGSIMLEVRDAIDNLVKEMTEEKE